MVGRTASNSAPSAQWRPIDAQNGDAEAKLRAQAAAGPGREVATRRVAYGAEIIAAESRPG